MLETVNVSVSAGHESSSSQIVVWGLPGAPQGKTLFKIMVSSLFAFFIHSLRGSQWSFPEATWHRMASSLLNVCLDSLVLKMPSF